LRLRIQLGENPGELDALTLAAAERQVAAITQTLKVAVSDRLFNPLFPRRSDVPVGRAAEGHELSDAEIELQAEILPQNCHLLRAQPRVNLPYRLSLKQHVAIAWDMLATGKFQEAAFASAIAAGNAENLAVCQGEAQVLEQLALTPEQTRTAKFQERQAHDITSCAW
jgi:hypothetical protein